MNRTKPVLVATAAVIVAVFVGAGTEAKAQYSRRNPIVEAVRKAAPSVVTVILPRSQYQTRDTMGTGVIIDERGYIITNRHVVGSRQWVRVKLADGTTCDGQVFARFSNYDLAVVKIDVKKKLQALTLAPVSDLMVGEEVIAIGHPYGYANTVSRGIISALNRTITMPTGEVLSGLIQTDASINPGNSGGPLLNINGELIGINAAIRDGAQGIAFAINAGTVRKLLRENLSALRLSGVGHGLEVQEKVLKEVGDRQRVAVAAVYQDTPADAAGLREGDVILQIGGRRVYNSFDLERALWGSRPGQQVEVTVVRGEKKLQVRMTLADGHNMNRTVRVDFSRRNPGADVATPGRTTAVSTDQNDN